jgi:peptide/nickel transport system substrate-binding protein
VPHRLGRRALFAAATTASGAALPRFATAQSRAQRVLRFVPQANLSSLDPVTTTAYVVRNHGYMAYDTLYGTDEGFEPRPQMAEGPASRTTGGSGPSPCATGSASTTASGSGRGTPRRASGAG